MISADLRFIESNRIQADESALSRESVPVSKDVGVEIRFYFSDDYNITLFCCRSI